MGPLVLGVVALAGCVSDAAKRQGIVGTRVLDWRAATRIEVDHERLDRRGGDAQRSRLIIAGVDVDADLSVYDPRLLHATIAATIAQSWAKARGPDSGSDSAGVPRYHLRAEALQGSSVSGYVVAGRDDARSFSQYRFIRSTIEQEEAGLDARFDEYHASVNVRHSQSDIRGIDASGDRRIDGTYVAGRLGHSDARSRTTIDVDVTDLDEDPSDREDRTRKIDIVNDFRTRALGGFPNLRFRTGAQFWRQRNTSGSMERKRLYETVAADLHEDLTSNTGVEYRSFRNGVSTTNNAIRQGFVHTLYDSLTTTLGGFKDRDDFQNGRADRIGGELDLDYTKAVSFGELRAGFSVRHERQENDFDGEIRPVFGEQKLLQSGRASLLNMPNVVEPSIVVRDESGAVIYQLGFDYVLRAQGDGTQVQRVPTGLIPDGSIVLVDYEYETSGDLEFETRTRSARIEFLILDSLLIYIRKVRQRQSELEGDGAGQLEDSDTSIYGAEFTWGRLRVAGERGRHRSSFSPYADRSGTISYEFDVLEHARLGAFSTHSRTEFESGADSQFRTYGGTATYTPNARLRIEVQPVWQEQRGRDDELDILDLRLRATYTYGKIELELLVDHRQEEREDDRASDTRILFSVVRQW